jgi:hypothetical protein
MTPLSPIRFDRMNGFETAATTRGRHARSCFRSNGRRHLALIRCTVPVPTPSERRLEAQLRSP